MKGSDFIFTLVQLMCYKCHKVNLKRGGSYIDSPNWIKKNDLFNTQQLLHEIMTKLSVIQKVF